MYIVGKHKIGYINGRIKELESKAYENWFVEDSQILDCLLCWNRLLLKGLITPVALYFGPVTRGSLTFT